MDRRNIFVVCLLLSIITSVHGLASNNLSFEKYHSPKEVAGLLKSLSAQYPDLTKLIVIGQSASKKELFILRIAAQPKGSVDADSRPAVFVSGNIEGCFLIGTEAALMLIEKLLTKYGTETKITSLLENKTVFIAPLLNPDAAESYFMTPRVESRTNNHPMDDDGDGLIDEDGAEDLNNDGLITQMRIVHPEGNWIQDPRESRLMRKSVQIKIEVEKYKIYTEGLDNDGDGKYNEDPLGGIELNRNFPINLDQTIDGKNIRINAAKEILSIIKFLTDFPNIALVLNFSLENTLFSLQHTGKKQTPNDKFIVPPKTAALLKLDAQAQYTMPQLIQKIKSNHIILSELKLNQEEVSNLLGLNTIFSINKQDTEFLEVIQKDYKKKLIAAGLNREEKKSDFLNKGSLIAFCYFQIGVPVISSTLWTIPLLLELTKQEKPIVNELFSTQRDFHTDFYFLNWSDKILGGNGFVEWTPFQHPGLGKVEIGGFVPFAKINPPHKQIKNTIFFDTDFYIDLIDHLAELKIKEIKIKMVGIDLYKVTVYFINQGWFPTSTAQGRKTRYSPPIIVRLKTTKNQMIYSGQPFQEIPLISERGDIKRLEWTIKGKKSSQFILNASSPRTGSVTTIIELK